MSGEVGLQETGGRRVYSQKIRPRYDVHKVQEASVFPLCMSDHITFISLERPHLACATFCPPPTLKSEAQLFLLEGRLKHGVELDHLLPTPAPL